MADDKDEKAQSQNIEIRTALNDAYAFIEGSKATQTFSATTFEDCMDAQIERLVGDDTPQRPNATHRIDKIEQAVIQAVAQIKALPDDYFQENDTTTNVNTKK